MPSSPTRVQRAQAAHFTPHIHPCVARPGVRSYISQGGGVCASQRLCACGRAGVHLSLCPLLCALDGQTGHASMLASERAGQCAAIRASVRPGVRSGVRPSVSPSVRPSMRPAAPACV
eukprot:714150-Pleurochrysis_carterae.AAC.4